jgi:uncharacterized protein (DUF2141 family)
MMKNRFNVKQLSARVLLCCALPITSAGWLAAQAPATPSAAPTAAPVTAKSTLTVHITGFRNAKGKVNIALFRDGKGFPTDAASMTASQRLEIDPQTMSATAVFTGLPQGAYAVSILHDENLTGKMDFDAQGIPQEGYGISNNPDTTGGPPTPEQAKFPVNQTQVTIEIKLVYWN